MKNFLSLLIGFTIAGMMISACSNVDDSTSSTATALASVTGEQGSSNFSPQLIIPESVMATARAMYLGNPDKLNTIGCYTCGQSYFCYKFRYNNDRTTFRIQTRWTGPCGNGGVITTCQQNSGGYWKCENRWHGEGPCAGDSCKG